MRSEETLQYSIGEQGALYLEKTKQTASHPMCCLFCPAKFKIKSNKSEGGYGDKHPVKKACTLAQPFALLGLE